MALAVIPPNFRWCNVIFCAAFRAVVPAVPASSHLRRLAPSGLVTAACALRLQSQHVRLPRSDIASSAVARVQKSGLQVGGA